MTSAVLLIQALGGGWDSSSLSARPECCGKLTSSSTQPSALAKALPQTDMTPKGGRELAIFRLAT
jgi:hypothetical protein